MTIIPRHRLGLVSAVTVVGAAALLAGCSSTPSSPSAAKTTTSTSTSTSTGKATTTTSHAGTTKTTASTTPVPRFSLKDNARTQVALTGACTAAFGAWVQKGTAHNTASSTRTFLIVVDFITQPGDTVLDTNVVKVANVAPGATEPWSTSGAAGQKNLACVIRNAQSFPPNQVPAY